MLPPATRRTAEANDTVRLAAWRRELVAAGLPLDRQAPLVFPAYGNVDLEAALRREAVA
jgi:hypothetical protein